MENEAASFKPGDSLSAIDALRGYAIVLVLTAHSATPNIVWPVRRVMLMGVYGVQLFFIASAVTLLMSWSRSTKPFGIKTCQFLLHRFFRIAPLYFLAIAFYWFVNNVALKEFSMARLLSTMLFVNSWNPYLLPTTDGWTPVPGGWSISVEFCFYFIFPILAVLCRNLRSSAVFLAIAFICMVTTTLYGQTLYPEIPTQQRNDFLYFWFPNQLVIFAIGFCLYQCLQSATITAFIAKCRVSSAIVSIGMFAALIALSYDGMNIVGLAPTYLLVAMAFALWAAFVLIKPERLTVNSIVVAIGKVSFSIYIVHFAVIKLVRYGMNTWWPIEKEGMLSITYAGVSVALALAISYMIASSTYSYIEKPGIDFGKNTARRLFS